MAAVPTVTEQNVSIAVSVHQTPQVSGAAINAGVAVAQNASGRVIPGGTGAIGIATNKTAGAGVAVNVVRQGVLDGYDLSAYAYGTAIYAQAADGVLTDVSTSNIYVGRVIAAHSQILGQAPDKVLDVNIA